MRNTGEADQVALHTRLPRQTVLNKYFSNFRPMNAEAERNFAEAEAATAKASRTKGLLHSQFDAGVAAE
jgi:hypothetical protein